MTPIIDLIAGIVFIYFLLAMVNNSCIELYASFVQLRSTVLRKWIEQNFGATLSQLTRHTPYIHSKTFAQQVLSHLGEPVADASLTDVIHKSGMPNHTQKLLCNFATAAKQNQSNETAHVEKQLEQWFDRQMEQLTNVYRRKTVVFTFVFACAITMALNIDTLQLANYLYQHPVAREQWALVLRTVASNNSITQFDKAQMQESLASMNTSLPIGWPDEHLQSTPQRHPSVWYYLRKGGGLLITMLAICLGAPFWFNVLNKIANIGNKKTNS